MPRRRFGFLFGLALACAVAGQAFAQADGASVLCGHHDRRGCELRRAGQAYGNMVQNFEYELDVGGRTLLGVGEILSVFSEKYGGLQTVGADNNAARTCTN